MPEVIYLLKPDGSIEELPAEHAALYETLNGETDPAALSHAEQCYKVTTGPVVIAFNGAADGRGFSLLNSLRYSIDEDCLVYAGGHINPDQLSLAFQSGFDGVLVGCDRWHQYGSASWQSALSPVVDLSYALTRSHAVESIWQRRHST